MLQVLLKYTGMTSSKMFLTVSGWVNWSAKFCSTHGVLYPNNEC